MPQEKNTHSQPEAKVVMMPHGLISQHVPAKSEKTLLSNLLPYHPRIVEWRNGDIAVCHGKPRRPEHVCLVDVVAFIKNADAREFKIIRLNAEEVAL
jgi:hypothetical protein